MTWHALFYTCLYLCWMPKEKEKGSVCPAWMDHWQAVLAWAAVSITHPVLECTSVISCTNIPAVSCMVALMTELVLIWLQDSYLEKKVCLSNESSVISSPRHLLIMDYINSLAQGCSNSIALVMELLQSCAEPLIEFVLSEILWVSCSPMKDLGTSISCSHLLKLWSHDLSVFNGWDRGHMIWVFSMAETVVTWSECSHWLRPWSHDLSVLIGWDCGHIIWVFSLAETVVTWSECSHLLRPWSHNLSVLIGWDHCHMIWDDRQKIGLTLGQDGIQCLQ